MRRATRRRALAGAVIWFAVGHGDAYAAGAPQAALPPMTQVNGDVTSYRTSSSVAVNAAGQAVVGWSEIPAGDPGSPLLAVAFVAFRSATGTWSAPESVSAPGQQAGDVHVAIDPIGAATIAWTQSVHFDDQAVRVVRHTDAGYSDSQTFVPPTGGANRLDLATNAGGDAVLAWTGYVPCPDSCPGQFGTGDIFAATRTAGASFGAPQQLSDPASLYRTAPVASIGAHGDIAVAWEEGTTTALHVRVRQQPAGGAFAPELDLAAAHVSSTVPDVVVAPSGAATVTWWESGAMHASRLGIDGSIASTQTLAGTYATPFALGSAALAVDGAGRVTAAWIANDGLWTAAADPGADLGSAVMIDHYATAGGSKPALAADPAGGTLLAWLDDNALESAWQPAGESAFRPAATIRGSAYSDAPRVSLAGGSALLTAWFGERSDRTSLFATVGDPGAIAPATLGAPPPPARTTPQIDTTPPQLRITAASVVKPKPAKQSSTHAAPKELRVVVSATEFANVVATVTKRVAGTRHGKACAALRGSTSRGPNRPRACTLAVTVGRPFRSAIAAGSTTLVLGSAPRKGSYDIVLTGADAAGNAAVPATRHLVVR